MLPVTRAFGVFKELVFGPVVLRAGTSGSFSLGSACASRKSLSAPHSCFAFLPVSVLQGRLISAARVESHLSILHRIVWRFRALLLPDLSHLGLGWEWQGGNHQCTSPEGAKSCCAAWRIRTCGRC